MGKIKDFIYWRLPVSKKNFFERFTEVKNEFERIHHAVVCGMRDSYQHRREITDQLNCRLDELKGEVYRLHQENARLERIVTHYHKQDMQMFWEGYRKPDEKTEDAQRRFFMSLPKARGVDRNLQILETVLLKAFIQICEQNELEYWLFAGTVLGAVRHKGFIPWDDDVDTGMAREDINKLQKILQNNPDYKLTVKYDPWGYCLQIRFCFRENKLPVFIDVFPFDWCKDASIEIWQSIKDTKQKLHEELSDESNPLIQQFRAAGCVEADSLLGEKVAGVFTGYYDKLHRDGILSSKEDSEGLVLSFDTWFPYDDRNLLAKNVYFPLNELEFEGMKCRVPNQYLYMLHEFYGEDFYTFPCGEPHFIHADWKKYQKELQEEVDKRLG